MASSAERICVASKYETLNKPRAEPFQPISPATMKMDSFRCISSMGWLDGLLSNMDRYKWLEIKMRAIRNTAKQNPR
jgi:hypothetical protein